MRTFLYILYSSILTSTVCAGTMGSVAPQSDWVWVGTLSAGPVWANPGKTQTFALTPKIIKTYVANRASKALASGELFAGMQKNFPKNTQVQLGLAIAASSNANLSGAIWDDADPEFNNYIYSYKIQHTRVAVKGKVLVDNGFWLTPWVSGSLGVAFNNAHAYSNTPTIFQAVENPNFASHTRTSFTWTLGAGVQKALNNHWQVGVGYEFADWGKSQLGRAAQQTLNKGPYLSQFSTNGLLFNLTYLA